MLKNKSIVFLMFFLIFYIILSYGRNIIWGHDIPLWGDAAFKSKSKVRPINALGLSYMRGGFFNKAKKAFTKSQSLRPFFVKTHNNLGALYFVMEDFTSAEREFNFILKLEPNNMKARFNLAVLFYKHLGKYDESERILLGLIKTYKKNPKLYYTLGEVYRFKGENDTAIYYYNEAISIDKDYIKALEALSSLK